MPASLRRSSRPRLFAAAAFLVAAGATLATAPAAAQTSPAPPAAPAIAAGDSASVADVERLLAAMDAERAHNQSIELSLAAQMRANPALAPMAGVMRAFMARHMSYAAVRPDIIRAYRETYTAADVRDLTEFYGTALGRRLLAKMPLATARTQEIISLRMQAHLPELMQAIQNGMRGSAGGP